MKEILGVLKAQQKKSDPEVNNPSEEKKAEVPKKDLSLKRKKKLLDKAFKRAQKSQGGLPIGAAMQIKDKDPLDIQMQGGDLLMNL